VSVISIPWKKGRKDHHYWDSQKNQQQVVGKSLWADTITLIDIHPWQSAQLNYQSSCLPYTSTLVQDPGAAAPAQQAWQWCKANTGRTGLCHRDNFMTKVHKVTAADRPLDERCSKVNLASQSLLCEHQRRLLGDAWAVALPFVCGIYHRPQTSHLVMIHSFYFTNMISLLWLWFRLICCNTDVIIHVYCLQNS